MHSLPDITTIVLPSGTLPKTPGESQSNNVPVIVGAVFGSLAGLILIAGVVFFLRRRRRPTSKHVEVPPADLRPTPFMNEVTPLTASNIQEAQDHTAYNTPTPSKLNSEKLSAFLSLDSRHRNATGTDSSVAGGSSLVVSSRDGDSNLRDEVEQLRRVVENLSAQQSPYRQGLPDDPPPMYPSNQ
jgi:hypothetical protein